eukprot:1094106-Pelagomonas_calceolata.AAC.2
MPAHACPAALSISSCTRATTHAQSTEASKGRGELTSCYVEDALSTLINQLRDMGASEPHASKPQDLANHSHLWQKQHSTCTTAHSVSLTR